MYHPDRWTIIDYGEKFKEDRYAIIAGWGGSFTWGLLGSDLALYNL